MDYSKLLIEDKDQEYEASQDDVYAYAKQIGIDVNKELHLMWIAKEGISAKVPEPWLICSDDKDRVFYYNTDTSETSWSHPLDNYYANLVSDERAKSLNSASSDYGSKLSSLADAPPLSSSGKNSPLPFKSGKKDGGLSGRRFEFGHIENRRSTQLAPVRLNTLKMPPASIPKSAGGMSFMPKGSSFTKNIRRVKEDKDFGSQHHEELDYEHPHLDDSNESINSDESSKYSYEEIDDEKQIPLHEPYNMIDATQLSPMHSADESPDPVDINSLVKLRTKAPSKLESSLKTDIANNVFNKENSPSLSLRKVGQPTFLKPLTQASKKKSANKSSKATKKVKNKNPTKLDASLDDETSALNDDQDWLPMQDELEKKEKEKYEEMVNDFTKKLEEEEIKLRKEHSDRIKKIKSDLQKKIEEEEHTAEMSLQSLKESNKQKISEEENKLQKELEILSESLKNEVKKLEDKNALELSQKKKELEESSSKELANLKSQFESDKKNIAEAHEIEISSLQKAHEQRIIELKIAHEKGEHEITSSVPQKKNAQEELENLQKIIKEETQKYQDLLKERETILKEITSEKNSLDILKKETFKAQSTIEELQDEIDKTENDLDLLRSEKSGLISELNILKENISNQKANLSNFEKKLKTSFDGANCSKELAEIGINTNLSCNDCISKAVQASVSCYDVSSQIENISHSVLDAECQTSVLHFTANKSCQTVLVPSVDNLNVVGVCNDRKHLDSGRTLDKNLESALSGLSMKLDSRINVIEDQLRLIQENLSKPVAPQFTDSSQEFMQNQFSKSKTAPDSENRTVPPMYSINSSLPLGQFSDSSSLTSQSKCKCELGDPESCKVLQDVKNSVYHLNNILCASFAPPLRGSTVYQVTQPISNYSSPFDDFYAQLRQMQEKQRLVDLKHKCRDSAIQFTRDSPSNLKDASNSGRYNESKSSYHVMHSGMFSHNVSEDPLIRAKSIVLREKAKTWKEQQALQSSVSHIFSLNSSSEGSPSSNTVFMPDYNVPSSEQTFFKFEVDPETDFNMWMTRLNALQLRIRSHKIF